MCTLIDGASAKFSTNSHETDYSVAWTKLTRILRMSIAVQHDVNQDICGVLAQKCTLNYELR